MNVRDMFLVSVALFGKVWNLKVESGTHFTIDTSYDENHCSADTQVHGQVISDLFCAQICSRIEGCIGFFYTINTRACSTVKSVPETGNDCETGAGSVFYKNPDNFDDCGNPQTLANGRVHGDVSKGFRIVRCDTYYSLIVNGAIIIGKNGGSMSIPCGSSKWDVVECVLACETSDALVSGSNGLTDYQIQASTSINSTHGSASSRLDGDKAWIPYTIDQQQYLQYDFGGRYLIINEIITQGGGSNHLWTISYKLHFSMDCDNYTEYEKVFNGNGDIESHTSNMVNPALVGRCLRVNPQAWHEKIAMRVELKGC